MMNKYKKYAEYKDSGVEWVGEVPEHWEMRKLKHCVGINLNSLNEDTDPNMEFKYVDIGSVTYEIGIEKTEELVFKSAPSRARRIANNEDTIISTVRTYLKAIDYIDEKKSKYIYSTGFAVMTPMDIIYPKYLTFAVKSDFFTNQVDLRSKGMSYPAINSTDLSSLVVMFPPLHEQQLIANFLDEKTADIDKAISQKEQMIKLLNERKQIVINNAVTRGLNPDVKLKDSGIDWIGEIPEHWEVRKLKYYGHLVSGLTGKKGSDFDAEEDNDSFKPFIPFTNIANNTIIDTERYQYVLIRNHEVQNRIKYNDILFLMSSETYDDIAACSIYLGKDDELYLNSFCKGFRLQKKGLFPMFVNYLLKSSGHRTYFKVSANGFTRINLRQEFISNISILVPPLSEQQEISNYIEQQTTKIDTTITQIDQEITLLKEYKASLIDSAVRGKICLV